MARSTPRSPRQPSVRPAPRTLGKTQRSGARNTGSAPIKGGTTIPSVKVPTGAKVVTKGPKKGTAASGRAPFAQPRVPGLPKGTTLG